MREIKFRFYDPFNAVMIYSDNFDDLGKFFDEYYETERGGNNPKLMQYTGRKDRSGVDIYESDVYNREYPEVVKYENSTSSSNHHGGSYITNHTGYSFGDIKVIGNIHENPELLEKNK